MTTPNLIIEGVVIPFEAMGEISQRYGWEGGYSSDRMMDGSLDSQESWRKRVTTISASGWLPPALEAFDWSAPVTVDCIGQLSMASPASAIVLPSARRTDVAPFGFAVMPSGLLSASDASLSGNLLTITPVAGAVGYVAVYYPRLVCKSDGPTNDHQLNACRLGWELNFREV